MVDFEIVGDLLRKAKIPNKVNLKHSPKIIIEKIPGHVEFQFDRAGNLVDVDFFLDIDVT